MKLSAKSEYGVRMMADLASVYGRGRLSLSQIAERQGISVDFLEQLIAVLRKKGLVESVRGARGGYQLAKSPADITVGDVIFALEGPFIPMVCLEVDHEHQPDCCARLGFCTTRDVWVRLRDQVNATLTAISLADLVQPESNQPLLVLLPRADGASVAVPADGNATLQANAPRRPSRGRPGSRERASTPAGGA